MATLPCAPLNTASSPHLHGAADRAPLCCIEAFSFFKRKAQALIISHSKQKTPTERAPSRNFPAIAAAATQAEPDSQQVSSKEETEEQSKEDDMCNPSSRWYPVAFIDTLDKGKPSAVTIMGRNLVVWWDRNGESWQVWEDKCPHRLAPLSEGHINDKGELQCSYHGCCFSPCNGRCTLMPQAPLDDPLNACASVYPSVEQGGLIWFWPETRPELKGIASRKPAPSVFPLADAALQDQLQSGSLPYSYKESVENVTDPTSSLAHHGSQSSEIQDTESQAVLVTEGVQLRSEGGTGDLAEPVDNLYGELSNVFPERHSIGHSSEVLNIDSEGQDTTNYAMLGAGLVPYHNHLLSSTPALSGGGQLVADLTTAWDGLAGRLYPSITNGKHMQQILLALKLAFAAFYRAPEDGRLMLVNSLSIAYTLVDLQTDAAVMAAGLLRLAVEAGLIGISQVDQQLGSDVGRLLHDCMRFRRTLDQMDIFDEESAKAVRQFCLSYHDIQSITIEFSYRLQQMRHVHDLPRYQQQILALEALQIHAPLAHAIGTKEVSTELEDLAFKVVLPDSYKFLDNWLLSHWPDESLVLEDCKQKLSSALERDEKLKSLTDSFIISGRLKSRFSIMKKLLKDGRKREEVYDIVGLRIVINPKSSYDSLELMEGGQSACYRVLEIVRSLWEEVPGRLKDYIANPKSNGYESLHVALYLANTNSRKLTMELQVRTSMMDFKANDGEASHSLYKGGLTDPEQVQQLKKLMIAAAERAALSLKELTRETSFSAPASDDQVFLLFDKNKDGEISMRELEQVMGDLGVDGNEAHELMQLVDTNKDGSLSVDEFAEFKKQVSLLRGFDKKFSNMLGYTLRGSNAARAQEVNQEACNNMANSLSSKTTTSWSEVEASGMVRRENASSNEINISSSPPAIVLRKPVTVSRPTSEEAITDSLGTLENKTKDTLLSAMCEDSGSIDPTTGLKALH